MADDMGGGDLAARFTTLRSIPDLAAARALLDDAARSRDPDDPALLFLQAELARDERRWDDARRLLEHLFALQGGSVPARTYARLAEARRWQGDFEASASVARAGLARHPGDLGLLRARADAFSRLAATHRAKREIRQAVDVILRGTRLHPGDARLEIEAAELCMKGWDWDHAIERWRHIAAGEGHDTRAAQRLDEATKRWERARTSIEIARRDGLLRPGWFVYEGSAVWRHWRTRLPGHVRNTRPGSDLRRLRRGTRRLAGFAANLSRAVRSGFWSTPHGRERFDVLVAASDGGCVLMDTHRHIVARNVGNQKVTADQADLRARWALHVPSAAFRVHSDDRWLLEDLVTGRHLSELTTPAQIDVCRKLLTHYTALTRAEGRERPSSGPLEAIAWEAVPTALAELVRSSASRLCLDRWPCVPSSGDPDPKNLIVDPAGEPVMIDVMPMGWKPFVQDPLCIIGRFIDNPEVRVAYIDGEFDRELAALFRAAAIDVALDPDTRRATMALALARHSTDEARRLGDPGWDLLGQRLATIERWLLPGR